MPFKRNNGQKHDAYCQTLSFHIEERMLSGHDNRYTSGGKFFFKKNEEEIVCTYYNKKTNCTHVCE